MLDNYLQSPELVLLHPGRRRAKLTVFTPRRFILARSTCNWAYPPIADKLIAAKILSMLFTRKVVQLFGNMLWPGHKYPALVLCISAVDLVRIGHRWRGKAFIQGGRKFLRDALYMQSSWRRASIPT
jgi:hypothetical protein